MEQRWRKSEPVQCSREERRFMRRCRPQPAFIVWWRNGKTVEELRPKPKEKWTLVGRKVETTQHRMEWCAAASKYR